MAYGYFGTMRVHPGKREEVLAILLRASESLRGHGCHAYVVGEAEDPAVICVSELWDTKEAHDASLQLPEIREAIAQAMPMLTGEFTGYEMTCAEASALQDQLRASRSAARVRTSTRCRTAPRAGKA